MKCRYMQIPNSERILYLPPVWSEAFFISQIQSVFCRESSGEQPHPAFRLHPSYVDNFGRPSQRGFIDPMTPLGCAVEVIK